MNITNIIGYASMGAFGFYLAHIGFGLASKEYWILTSLVLLAHFMLRE